MPIIGKFIYKQKRIIMKIPFRISDFLADNGLSSQSLARKLGISPATVYYCIRHGHISSQVYKKLKEIVPNEILEKYKTSSPVPKKPDNGKFKTDSELKACKFVRITKNSESIIRKDFPTIPFAVNRLIDGYASIRSSLFSNYIPIIETVRESIIPITGDTNTSLRYHLSLKGIKHEHIPTDILLLIYNIFRG